jgi:threonine dehydrogenase-like Zn-dependent dehydrogenase
MTTTINKKMRAIGVLPKERKVDLLAHPAPDLEGPDQVKVRTIEVGVCGTDREICHFDYGTPPEGSDYLVLGHEALGEVVEVGPGVKNFRLGDLVVPSVRRPCPHHHCPSCKDDRQDFCVTGDFTERGIKMRHGYLTEYFVEEEKHLNIVPKELSDVAVLVEPLTVAEKALAQIWKVQSRLPWANGHSAPGPGAGKTAVVLGAGPVGILGAMALLVNGFKTWVYSRSEKPNPKAALCDAIGATYISSKTYSVEQFAEQVGRIDLVYEAVGSAQIAFDVLKVLGLNGVFVFTGIPGPKPPIQLEGDFLMRQMVLKNQIAVGTVNADKPAFESAIRNLGVFKQRWPNELRAIISGRFPMEAYRQLLLDKATGIKNVIKL